MKSDTNESLPSAVNRVDTTSLNERDAYHLGYPPKSNCARKSWWWFLVGAVLSVVLLVLAFRGVNWHQMFSVLRRGQLGYLLLACAALAVSYFVRGMRWRVILRARKAVHPLLVFWAIMVGYLGNNFLPMRAGELIRSVALGRRANLSNSFVLGTVLVERAIDVCSLLFISAMALIWLDCLPGWWSNALPTIASLAIAGAVVVLFASRLGSVLQRIAERLPISDRVRVRAVGSVQRFLLGVDSFRHFGRALTFSAFTVLVWSMDAVVAVTVGRAFHVTISLPLALLLTAALGLASAVPSTPGYVGVFQFVTVSVLAPFGISRSDALAYSIGFQATAYCTVVVFGVLGIWRLAVQSRPSTAAVVGNASRSDSD